ncbi:unnamed protein product, partial [Mesorhabditis spiculigera]
MCCSSVGQIVFGIVMFACFCLTLGAMFSPEWRTFKDDLDDTAKDLDVHSGIFSFNCRMPGKEEGSCDDWWDNLHTWEKVTVTCMCLALVTEILCLAWNLITFCACCCKQYIIHPLSLFATLVSLFLGVAVIVYGANNKDAFKDLKWKAPDESSEVGYSFYLAVAAVVLSVFDIFVAGITVFFAKKCL